MSLEHITHRDDGTQDIPGQDSPWDAWVSPSRLRNWCNDDPLLDWLGAYGEAKGFECDATTPDTDFITFIMARGRAFEQAAMRHLQATQEVVVIGEGWQSARDLVAARRTFEAMREGVPLIAQGVLWNPQERVYGSPDLLVRSDVLHQMFPEDISAEEAAIPANDLPGSRWHYRVVDIKFTTLKLNADGGASGDHLAYMAQVWLYNQALGRLQGFLPPSAFLLGRGWKKGNERGHSALERLARVDHARQLGARGADGPLATCVARGLEWIRTMRQHGAGWQVLPAPSRPELRPNLRNTADQPWHGAKRRIAQELRDLTVVPRVDPGMRRTAMLRGLQCWDHPDCCAASLGVHGATYVPQVDRVLEANRTTGGQVLLPEHIAADGRAWHGRKPVEFFVDFETVSDLDDDFTTFPAKGGTAMIFMIGCGFEDAQGTWQFRVFTAHRLAHAEERRIVLEWLDWMRQQCAARGTTLADARLFHWSHAETSTLLTAYNSAQARHGAAVAPALDWYDLLAKVAKAEPIGVRGAFGFGLKPIAKAMHAAGLLPTAWGEGPVDGMGAMVGAWTCEQQANATGCRLVDLPLMEQIEAYNEVDCRVMWELLGWLRQNR